MQTIRVINYHELSTALPTVWVDALERAGILRVLSRHRHSAYGPIERRDGMEPLSTTNRSSHDVLEFPPPRDVPAGLDSQDIAHRGWAFDVATYLDDELNINAVAAPEWRESSTPGTNELVATCFDIARSQLAGGR